uniref:SFRICE_037998 n=1 Tax=Spodoptera frugiperda TaxID=7108 RepID=A0A2H1WMB4_SPOFR
MDNETSLRLIEMYGSHSPLWDTRRKEYHDNTIREDLWDQIAQTFIQPKAALKLKMKSLLSSYRRERNREKTSNVTGSGRNKAYKSKWFAYEAFSFLHDRNNPIDAVDCGSHSEPGNTEQGTSEPGTSEQGTRDQDTNTKKPRKEMPANKRTYQESEYDAENQMIEEALEVMRKQNDSSNDPYIAFGMHIAAELRKYDATTLTKVKHSISNILYEADMELLNRSSTQDNRRGYFTSQFTDLDSSSSSNMGLTQLIHDLDVDKYCNLVENNCD